MDSWVSKCIGKDQSPGQKFEDILKSALDMIMKMMEMMRPPMYPPGENFNPPPMQNASLPPMQNSSLPPQNSSLPPQNSSLPSLPSPTAMSNKTANATQSNPGNMMSNNTTMQNNTNGMTMTKPMKNDTMGPPKPFFSFIQADLVQFLTVLQITLVSAGKDSS
ncbi:proline-rich receptor-like protein kinase PERK12 [Protopterus annectens]|uniref:proline-rich receptor-like protein kinase PERK12 n=1 Tax=Protopterus annectens TaxID=7888 RepID=UPI001CFA8AEE|nr:proline-rich receptor-like protein kinase PERK12 [Protopterus annectens]